MMEQVGDASAYGDRRVHIVQSGDDVSRLKVPRYGQALLRICWTTRVRPKNH